MRRTLHALLALACCLLSTQLLRAQLIYEPFDYDVGPLEGQVNPNTRTWAAMGTSTDDIMVSGSSLTIPGLGPSHSIGKSASYQGSGKTERLGTGVSAITSGSVYYSLAFRVNAYGNVFESPFGVFIAGLNSQVGTSTGQPTAIGTRLMIRPGSIPDSFHVGLVKNSSTNIDFSFDLTDHMLGETIFVVGRYSIGASVGDDTSALWINPSTDSFNKLTFPPPTLTNAAGDDLTNGVRSILLRQGFDSVPDITVDELRVDTSWTGVTNIPEPARGALLILLVAIIANRGRKVVVAP
jgi:hypothetical protein